MLKNLKRLKFSALIFCPKLGFLNIYPNIFLNTIRLLEVMFETPICHSTLYPNFWRYTRSNLRLTEEEAYDRKKRWHSSHHVILDLWSSLLSCYWRDRKNDNAVSIAAQTFDLNYTLYASRACWGFTKIECLLVLELWMSFIWFSAPYTVSEMNGKTPAEEITVEPQNSALSE